MCCDFEAELREFSGQDNHIHLLVHYPPKVQLSKAVNSLKGASSRGTRQPRTPVLWSARFWSGSYYAG